MEEEEIFKYWRKEIMWSEMLVLRFHRQKIVQSVWASNEHASGKVEV